MLYNAKHVKHCDEVNFISLSVYIVDKGASHKEIIHKYMCIIRMQLNLDHSHVIINFMTNIIFVQTCVQV